MPPPRKKLAGIPSKIGKVQERATQDSSTCRFHTFMCNEKDGIEKQLLEWYDKEKRQLPWRDIARGNYNETNKGYAIWVSEVMLQQTQVVTVIPYYNKWMKKWPTVQALSEASLDEVFDVWAGLGYYQRARRLHEGAHKVQSDLNGILPSTMEELMGKIPGVGRYTASAIASIAYSEAVGAVDGNVIRVLSRMRLIGSPVGTSMGTQFLWNLADSIVSTSRPGDFNQALMELGATVCTPRNPQCSTCPLRDLCLANRMNKHKGLLERGPSSCNDSSGTDIEETIPGCNLCLTVKPCHVQENVALLYPYKAPKKEARKEISVVLVVKNHGCYLMRKRTGKGRLLEGLLEFPNATADADVEDETKESDVVARLFNGLLAEGSAHEMPASEYVGEVSHIFSHIRATYRIHVVSVNDSLSRDIRGLWMTAEDVEASGVSTAMKKVLLHVENCVRSGSKPTKKLKSASKSVPDPKQPRLSFYGSEAQKGVRPPSSNATTPCSANS